MIKLRYGNTNTYFIDGLLFDTDMFGMLPLFFREIKRNGISVNEIKYVMASHYHPDHMGLISDLAEMGVKQIILKNQLGKIHFPDEIFRRQYGDKYRPIDETRAIIVSSGESRDFLKSIGLPGEIIPTESHSEDGISLILDDGSCFVGDLEPRQYADAYENNVALKKDWANILKYNPETVYFGHLNEQIL